MKSTRPLSGHTLAAALLCCTLAGAADRLHAQVINPNVCPGGTLYGSRDENAYSGFSTAANVVQADCTSNIAGGAESMAGIDLTTGNTAIGRSTTASGGSASAYGVRAQASGNGASALGVNSRASANSATATCSAGASSAVAVAISAPGIASRQAVASSGRSSTSSTTSSIPPTPPIAPARRRSSVVRPDRGAALINTR